MKPNRFPRPGYVTFLCVLTLIRAGLALVIFCAIEFRHIHSLDFFAPLSGLLPACVVIFGVSGAFMLKGANWARVLYFIASFPVFFFSAVFLAERDPLSIASSIWGFFLLVCYYLALTQPRANFFFTGRSTFFKKRKDDYDRPGSKPYRRKYDY